MSPRPPSIQEVRLEFEDMNAFLFLCGPRDENLRHLQNRLQVELRVRGNQVILRGAERQKVTLAQQVLTQLYQVARVNQALSLGDVDRGISLISRDPTASLVVLLTQAAPVPSLAGKVTARSPNQQKYLEAIRTHDLVFGIGPAGTGKTYLAMACGIGALISHQVQHIILTRPAVEAGERLGFLPGDLVEKVNPYLRPLYDALGDLVEPERGRRLLEKGQIEIAPLAFMRGRTLSNCFIILDEAQNCTVEQMKMFLTRLGYHSKAVVTGDVTQTDLPPERPSGLVHARRVLEKVPGIAMVEFDEGDVMRHPLVADILSAYEEDRKSSGNGSPGNERG
ncbi:MAG TPA: PhoH family protein [Myxococcota bacterium]|nr:PhoH family protein [Myxococcota bacterium]HQK50711.1 PhoH family protein [Myxococcota bacterium]